MLQQAKKVSYVAAGEEGKLCCSRLYLLHLHQPPQHLLLKRQARLTSFDLLFERRLM